MLDLATAFGAPRDEARARLGTYAYLVVACRPQPAAATPETVMTLPEHVAHPA
jgi:hypothetical protein